MNTQSILFKNLEEFNKEYPKLQNKIINLTKKIYYFKIIILVLIIFIIILLFYYIIK